MVGGRERGASPGIVTGVGSSIHVRFDGGARRGREDTVGLSLGFQFDETPNLETASRLEKALELVLGARHLPTVHIHQQKFHVFVVHVFEHDDRVFARVSGEEESEVRRADGEDQLVGREIVLAATERDVDK